MRDEPTAARRSSRRLALAAALLLTFVAVLPGVLSPASTATAAPATPGESAAPPETPPGDSTPSAPEPESATPTAGASDSPGASTSPGASPSSSPTEPPSPQDLAFLRAAHQDNLAEIRAGTAAEHRASSKAARNLGSRFVSEHVSLDADLQRVAARLGVAMPTTPTVERRQQLEEITANTGPEFDRLWVDAVTDWNTTALADTQTELRSGSLADVKDLARDSLSVIRGHLSRLQKVPTEGPSVPTEAPMKPDDYAASQSPLVVTVAAGMIAMGLVLLTATGRAAVRSRARARG